MECEKCGNHFCLSCLKMNESVYKYMSQVSVLWCCEECSKEVRALFLESEMVKKVNSMEEKLTRIEEFMTDLEIQLKFPENSTNWALAETHSSEETTQKTLSSEIQEGRNAGRQNGPWASIPKVPKTDLRVVFKEALEEKEREELERENRVRNFVVFQAKESESDKSEERIRHDEDLVKELLTEIQVEVTVEKVIRLGRRESGKLRPLKVALKDSSDKTQVMDNLKKLRDAPDHLKKLMVSHDLTPAQRDDRNKLVKELKLKEDENGRLVVRSAPGPRWDPKVVRLKNRPINQINRQ